MSKGTFPRPYLNDVPDKPGPGIETVDFDNLGIGARKSGTPREASQGPKPIEHVGGSATGKS